MAEMTERAIYEDGVFRPIDPVTIDDGESVQLNCVRSIVLKELPIARIETEFSTEQRTALQKITAANTWEEKLHAAHDAARFDPPLPDGFDIELVIERNRRPWLFPVEPSNSLED